MAREALVTSVGLEAARHGGASSSRRDGKGTLSRFLQPIIER